MSTEPEPRPLGVIWRELGALNVITDRSDRATALALLDELAAAAQSMKSTLERTLR